MVSQLFQVQSLQWRRFSFTLPKEDDRNGRLPRTRQPKIRLSKGAPRVVPNQKVCWKRFSKMCLSTLGTSQCSPSWGLNCLLKYQTIIIMINVSFLEPWILSSMGQWLFQRISQWLIWLCHLLWRPPCWCWAGQQIFGRCYSRRYWGSGKVCPTVGGVRELQTTVCRESRLWFWPSLPEQESIHTSS